MTKGLRDAIGERGEMLFKLAITSLDSLRKPLFRATFLGDKWPAADYFVELCGVRNCRAGLFVQVRTTTTALPAGATHLRIGLPRSKCEQLYEIPGPTFVAGVHEPTQKVYILSLHSRPTQGVTRIPLKHVLDSNNLRVLHDEVRQFWRSSAGKPKTSVFT
jgi:hypothetical protein